MGVICRLLLLFALVLPFISFGQEFGGNRPSLRWYQLNSDTARIIFQKDQQHQAREILSLTHSLAATQERSLGSAFRKINIVLQSAPVLSNGYVSLAPYRSEFYLTPRQNSFELGSIPWHKSLALHEYRHVEQYNNFRKGLTRLFFIVFGEEGESLAANAAIPDWFWEGDAVLHESKFSWQGRGRLPFFFNDFRSLLSSNKQYSWMKLRNGSLRDFVPDHYRLGYLVVKQGSAMYGDDLWKKVTSDAAAFKGLFYPFQRAFKRHTGSDFRTFRDSALSHLYDIPNDQSADSSSMMVDVAAQYAAAQRHFASDQEFPQWIDSAQIVYSKFSYDERPSFVLMNTATQQEELIAVRNISPDSYFSYKTGQVIYTSFDRHPRWGWETFSNITILDIASKKQRKLSIRSRYFSPDLSDDLKKIVAVHQGPEPFNRLDLLDASSGKLLTSVQRTDSLFFTFPKFVSDSTVAAACRNKSGKMAMMVLNIYSGQVIRSTPFVPAVLGYTQISGDTIFFTMAYNGRDKMCAWNGQSVQTMEIAGHNISGGCYSATKSYGKIAWTEFSAAGFRIFHVPVDSVSFEPVDFQNIFSTFDVVSHNDLIDNPPPIRDRYNVQGYPKTSGLFNFHSRRPFFSDPDYSFSVVSENILNTLRSELFVSYNRNENYKEAGANVEFAGWFPVLRLGGFYTFDRLATDSSRSLTWNELNGSFAVRLPLTFYTGRSVLSIQPLAGINTKRVMFSGESKLENDDREFNFYDLSVSVTNQVQRARQHIFPKFAQSVSFRTRSIINKYTAHQYLASGQLYFPGLFRNHHIVLTGSFQSRDTLRQYIFSNNFPFARGYAVPDFPRMSRISANYHFPILYPDRGFANIFYLLRVRSNVYYDHAQTQSLRTGTTFSFRSAGAEIYFDSKWWNQVEVSFGFRYARLLDQDIEGRPANRWEFIVPLNLLSR
jgi:hypothetical protein